MDQVNAHMQNRYSEYHQLINLYTDGRLGDRSDLIPKFSDDVPSSDDYEEKIKLRTAFIRVLNEEMSDLQAPSDLSKP